MPVLVTHVYLVWKLRHDDIWGNQLKHRWFIASEVCVEGSPHDLHIRLRHRLLLQPRGFEG